MCGDECCAAGLESVSDLFFEQMPQPYPDLESTLLI